MPRTLRNIKLAPLAKMQPPEAAVLAEERASWHRSSAAKKISLKHRGLSVLLSLVSYLLIPPDSYAEPPTIPPWQLLRPGLESIETTIQEGFVFSSTISAVRASKDYFKPRVFRAAEFGPPANTARNICKLSGASACINANFFDEQRRPLGAVISRGIIHKKLHRKGGTLTGVFVTTKDSFFIVHRSNFSPDNVLEAFQAGPRLISDGKSVAGIKTTSAQGALSILCIDKTQDIILAKVALSFFTQYPRRIQETLRQAPFHCVQALNLDGGSSSQLFASGTSSPRESSRETTLDSPGRDMVPVIFALMPLSSPSQPKTPPFGVSK
jgi:hypothetical protein